MPHGEGPLWLDSANLRPLVACFQSFLTKFNVGWSPWTAVDALVGLRLTGLARPDLGVRRGRGRPPHIHRYKNFRNRTLVAVAKKSLLRAKPRHDGPEQILYCGCHHFLTFSFDTRGLWELVLRLRA
jgi:hypothetical protein